MHDERLISESLNKPQVDRDNVVRELVTARIEKFGIYPNENLGQHFLVDGPSIDLLTQSVSPGSTVIEIGAGIGQLTEALAQKAGKVVAVEIDRWFEPVLTEVVQQHPNVQVIFGDAIALKLQDLIQNEEEVQIVTNLPFHITEPFLHKIAGLPVESVTLVIGQRLVDAIQASSEESAAFGQLTLLSQTFFDTDVIATVEKQKSIPVPRTNSAIIRLIPKEEHEFRSSKRDFLLRRLFQTARKKPLVKNVLKEGLIEFAQSSRMGTRSKKEHNQRLRSSVKTDLKRMVAEHNHFGEMQSVPPKPRGIDVGQLTQNQARTIIEAMGIPASILDKPFEQLNNQELKILSRGLRL